MKSVITRRRLLFLLVIIAVFLIARQNRNTQPIPPRSSASADSNVATNWDKLMIASQKALRNNDALQAASLCEQAMEMAATFGPRDSRYSKSQVQRAEIYCWEKKPALAEKMFDEAIANCEKAAGPNSMELAFPLSSLANFYTFVSVHPDRVTPLLLRILKIVQDAPGHKDVDVIMWSRNVGQSYQAQNQFMEAEPYFKQAVDLAEKIDRKDWFPHELLTAADFYRAWGKYDQAGTLANRALAIREDELKNSNDVDAKLDVTVCLDNLGQTDLARGKPDEAETVFRRSLTMVETFMTSDQSDLAPRLTGLATALRNQGKYEESESLYKRALLITEKNAGPNTRDTAEILDGYALLLTDAHKPDAADAALKRALQIRKTLSTQ